MKRKRSEAAALDVPFAEPDDAFVLLTEEEESRLLAAYERRLLHLCDEIGFDLGIASTAAIFFKRFYVAHSPRDFPPMDVLHTSIFLAIKTEACPYTEVREFSRKLSHARESRMLLTGHARALLCLSVVAHCARLQCPCQTRT
jgi:hypothetical protein